MIWGSTHVVRLKHSTYFSRCTTGCQSNKARFTAQSPAPGTCWVNVHWAALPLAQRVVTVFPGTLKPSNLTCLPAEWENPFRLDLRLSVWIIQPVCLIGMGQAPHPPPKAWLMVPRPDLFLTHPLSARKHPHWSTAACHDISNPLCRFVQIIYKHCY